MTTPAGCGDRIAGKAAVLVFAKAPVPGRVKTRLAAGVGAEQAALIQRRLMRHALETAVAAGLGPVTLYCAPDTRHRYFRRLRQELGAALRSQRGADLGARMHHALERAVDRHPAAVLIGSDCPDIDAAYLRRAAGMLTNGGTDVVLGPAVDGGYVMLGATRVHPALFEGIEWGSGTVLAATRERLRGLGWRWGELEALADVDRPGDLTRLDPALLA